MNQEQFKQDRVTLNERLIQLCGLEAYPLIREIDRGIKAFIQKQQAKDKERLLEGVKTELLKYEISGVHYLIQELEKVINKIYD